MNTTALEPVFDAIDVDRMNRRLDDLWAIGRRSGGVTRLAYSEDENEAHDYVLGELDDEYAVEVDSTGNAFATRSPGAERSIFTGSHLDTVHDGGRLDGTVGVVVALEAIEALAAGGVEPPCPPTLAIFRGEESARFGHHTIGSRAALGMLEVETFSATDDNGVPLWQAMQDAGFRPRNLSEPSIEMDRVAAFLETHIEQGQVLEEEDLDLGIVSSIRAPVRYRVEVTGRYDHSGATPMGLRRDALAGAAEMICAIERIGIEAAEEGDLVATVGDVRAISGAINKVCGEARFVLDVRSADVDHRDRTEEAILEAIEAVAADRGLGVEPTLLERSSPVDLDDELVDHLVEGAEASGSAARTMPSGGGHDAMNFQLNGVPTGMYFVPSLGGLSHNPEEATTDEALGHAARALAWAIATYEDER